jgi:methylenetetrahydrofolate reductase (NADPH)
MSLSGSAPLIDFGGRTLSNLRDRIEQGKFVITAEIVPPLSASKEPLLVEAAVLGSAVQAVNVTDAAAGRTSMSSFAAAAILKAGGYEPILQVTCRDRNRIALAGELLGAAAQGIENVLVLHGDDPSGGDQPDTKPVFDLNSSELMAVIRDMRDKGELPSQRKIDSPPNFFIGGADVPQVPGPDWNPGRQLAKIDAGAGFMQTQFCFDIDTGRAYMERLAKEGISDRVGIILGVGPIRSAKSARWMNENLFGVHVPHAVIERLEQAEDQSAEGMRFCAELIQGLQQIPGVAGVHIMAPGGGVKSIASVLAALPAEFREGAVSRS